MRALLLLALFIFTGCASSAVDKQHIGLFAQDETEHQVKRPKIKQSIHDYCMQHLSHYKDYDECHDDRLAMRKIKEQGRQQALQEQLPPLRTTTCNTFGSTVTCTGN